MGKLIPSITKKGIYAFSVVVVLLLITGVSFYWNEIRPAKIKHDCSWVRKTSPAKPAEPAMTEDQLRAKGMLEDCSRWNFEDVQNNPFMGTLRKNCESENKKKIEDYRYGKAAVPAKEWWVKAEEEEYKFCLHDKGL